MDDDDVLVFSASLYAHSSEPGSWHFLTVPPEISDDVRQRSAPGGPGFGTVPVEVTVGAMRWRTSLFPDTASGCYVLPVKQAVRAAEMLEVGDVVRAAIVLNPAGAPDQSAPPVV